jgi:hypothetical protein
MAATGLDHGQLVLQSSQLGEHFLLLLHRDAFVLEAASRRSRVLHADNQ